MRSEPCNLQRRIFPEMITLLTVTFFHSPHLDAVIDERKISDKVPLKKNQSCDRNKVVLINESVFF